MAKVDTKSDPSEIDFPIPANDDASKSISLIVDLLCQAVEEGLNERKMEKDKEPGQRERRSATKKGDSDDITDSYRRMKEDEEDEDAAGDTDSSETEDEEDVSGESPVAEEEE
jgi:small subunit ribosomal protein S2